VAISLIACPRASAALIRKKKKQKQKFTAGNQPAPSLLASGHTGTHGHIFVQCQGLCPFFLSLILLVTKEGLVFFLYIDLCSLTTPYSTRGYILFFSPRDWVELLFVTCNCFIYIAEKQTRTYSKHISRDRYPAILLARLSDLHKTQVTWSLSTVVTPPRTRKTQLPLLLRDLATDCLSSNGYTCNNTT
jgi:hypothetical protein